MPIEKRTCPAFFPAFFPFLPRFLPLSSPLSSLQGKEILAKLKSHERRKYRFQVRIWPMFVVVGLFVVLLCGNFVNGVWSQRSMVAQIEALGGQIYYDVNISELGAVTPLKDWFGIDAVANVGGVDSMGRPFKDTELKRLQAFPHLESVRLWGAEISDSGLQYLQAFKRLKEVDLTGTNIGDEGLRHLQSMTWLEDLNISSTKVTDAGLKYLASVTTLRELWLDKTQVSDAGIAELQKSLPKCRIIRQTRQHR